MQVAIIASGSRGDVQPHVALGLGLKRAGHAVRVVTSRDFEELVTSHELDFFDLGGNMEAVARDMQHLLETGNFIKILSAMGKAAERFAQEAARNGLEGCRDADVIISGLGGLFIGLALSEKLGIPFVQAYLYPFAPTSEFPGVLTPVPRSPLLSWANRPSHRLTQQMMWQTTRAGDNKARTEVLGMRPASFWGPFGDLGRHDRLALYGYSAHVIPTPRDWGTHQHVTGYWFLEPSASWQPPSDLLAFLDAGPAPVFIGFGSMGSKDPEATADLVLGALARTGQRGVLSSGWGGMNKDALPDSVYMVGSIPHAWLLPRMSAVVHHGGAGTTAAGLSAGVPSIVTPFMGDQAFWADRVFELGVGPKPIARRHLSVSYLSDAIEMALGDDAMRDRAADLGGRIRSEDGVAKAVALIEQAYGER